MQPSSELRIASEDFALPQANTVQENLYLNPAQALGIAVHKNPGLHALLLGSGVSASAGVASGWDVLMDLIRQFQPARNESVEPDPEYWFKHTFQEEPNYSRIMKELGRSPSERQGLLRGYFEPTEEERLRGVKQPTAAHLAIAQLVSHGYFRVILTTNFDRLLENALSAAGLEPVVLRTEEDVEQAMPLVHSPVTIVKVNGDYLNLRFRNTEEELSGYGPAMSGLVSQVLSEYGLIVCGWSGRWDDGLRRLWLETPNPSFASTYWTGRTRSFNEEKAQELMGHRNAIKVPIGDADSFFTELAAQVEAHAAMVSPVMLSTQVVQDQTKLFLPNPIYRIRLRDMVLAEVDRIRSVIDQTHDIPVNSEQEVFARLSRYEQETLRLRTMLAVGCFYGEPHHNDLWRTAVERLLVFEAPVGWQGGQQLRRYPALLAYYTAGIAAAASRNYPAIATLLLDTTAPDETPVSDRGNRALGYLHPGDVLNKALNRTTKYQQSMDPGLLYLFVHQDEAGQIGLPQMWNPVRDLLINDPEFHEALDRFEHLRGIQYLHSIPSSRPPVPLAVYRRRWEALPNIAVALHSEVTTQWQNWGPLKAGMFGGDHTGFLELAKKYGKYVAEAATLKQPFLR